MACTPVAHNADRRHQGHFRTLLQAISRPGRLFRFEGPLPSWPGLALAECLLDHEVGFCIAGNDRDGQWHAALHAATGAGSTPTESAPFLFVLGPCSGGIARSARRGSAENPEDGATIVYCLDFDPTLADRRPESDRFRIRLSGPGIAEPEGIAPEMRGIDISELRELQTVNADFPRGVDAFFIRSNGEVMALPRSTRIQVR